MEALNITRQQCFNAILVITVATVFLLVIRTMTNERTVTFLSAPKSTFLSGRLSFLSSFFFSNNGSDSDDDENSSEMSRDCGVVVSWEDEEVVTQTRKERKHPFQRLTVVTAYFDIGTFGKLIPSNTRSNMTYFQWFQKFGHVNNPLVVYTDSDAFVQHVLQVRFHLLARTRVVKVPRDLIWAFRVRSKVAEVYAHPGYPKHFPNTVNPDYTCAIHAKFAVMRNAILNGYFPNEYYVWVDASGFRDLDIAADESISLNTPFDLDPTRVMFSQVTYPDFRTTPTKIFHESTVWVAGDAFIGKRDVVLQFSEQYRQATEIFLDRNLSNSDQQVIFAMYTNEGRLLVKPTVELQTITGDWFGVGYHCILGGRS